MKVYVIIGIKENVYQDTIGGPFVEHPDKEIIKICSNLDDAINFVKLAKLSKGKRQPYGDTVYYRGGYYDMEIEEHEIEENNVTN